MAVYQDARRRGLVAPGSDRLVLRPRDHAPERRRAEDALPRRRARAATRSGRRRLPVGTVLGGIAFVFVLAFFSLAQAVRVSASNYEVDRLALQRDRLEALQRDLLSDLNRLGSEPAIRKLAFDAGLGQLDAPIVLPAH